MWSGSSGPPQQQQTDNEGGGARRINPSTGSSGHSSTAAATEKNQIIIAACLSFALARFCCVDHRRWWWANIFMNISPDAPRLGDVAAARWGRTTAVPSNSSSCSLLQLPCSMLLPPSFFTESSWWAFLIVRYLHGGPRRSAGGTSGKGRF